MQTVSIRNADGKFSEPLKGVTMLEAFDLHPHFLHESDPKVSELKAVGASVFTYNFASTADLAPRSFASMQLRARNAVRALFEHDSEHLLLLCTDVYVNGIDLAFDLVCEITGKEPAVAYAPTKFELFGSDSEPGLVTVEPAEGFCTVVMPCSYLIDHPRRIGMLDACLAQNGSLKLILTGNAEEIATISGFWAAADSALRSESITVFGSEDAVFRIGSLISSYVKRGKGLLHFTGEAVALLASYSCRLSGDRRYAALPELKLFARIKEASSFAVKDKAEVVSGKHVLKSLCADDFRNNYLAESVMRDHRDRQLLIATEGAVTGQINGLSVVETIGTAYEYGEPVRITATARAGGEGDVIDIERKAELAGQIHAKAMMIINGFLTREFGSKQPLPVSASLVFEQSYSEIDGDSASLTGLCAVISALADIPVRQDLAVTGAVDQFGDVQAVGGVNEKIEGFFKVCRLNGLSGTQGVIIPSSCVHQLVLRPAVIKAVQEGRFRIFTVSHVTSAVKLLTAADWGDSETEGTVCCRINERLGDVLSCGHEDPWYMVLKDKILSLFEKEEQQGEKS